MDVSWIYLYTRIKKQSISNRNYHTQLEALYVSFLNQNLIACIHNFLEQLGLCCKDTRKVKRPLEVRNETDEVNVKTSYGVPFLISKPKFFVRFLVLRLILKVSTGQLHSPQRLTEYAQSFFYHGTVAVATICFERPCGRILDDAKKFNL